ncbi:hypothetical protein ACYJ2M_39025, partial [Streptomyces sp. DT9]
GRQTRLRETTNEEVNGPTSAPHRLKTKGLSRNPWRACDDSCGTSPRCRNARELVEVDGTTGTPAHFKPDESLGSVPLPEDGDLSRLATAWPHLEVQGQ